MSFPTRNRQEGAAHDARVHMSFIFGEESTQSSSFVLCRHRSMQAQDRQEIDKLRQQLAITQSLFFFFFGISSSTKPYILRQGRLETDHPAVLSKTLHVRGSLPTSACLRKEQTSCCVPGFRSCFFTTCHCRCQHVQYGAVLSGKGT